MFREIDLKITIEANKSVVDFLDVTLDLNSDTYEPYCKPNNTILYVHAQSNHPNNILKNIPIGVQNRISELSKTEEIFDKQKYVYQEALNRAGYSFTLKYIKPVRVDTDEKAKKRSRKRNVTWFNPPFSRGVETDVGKKNSQFS